MYKQKYRWGRRETLILISRYEQEGPRRLAAEFGRSPDSVMSAASRLGLKSRTRRQRQALTRRKNAAKSRTDVQ